MTLLDCSQRGSSIHPGKQQDPNKQEKDILTKYCSTNYDGVIRTTYDLLMYDNNGMLMCEIGLVITYNYTFFLQDPSNNESNLLK